MAAGFRRLMAIAGGVLSGVGVGGVLSIVLSGSRTMNAGFPVVLAGVAVGLGVGLMAAAMIGTGTSGAK